MACDKEQLVQAYLDGELDPASAIEIERHLETCPTCPGVTESVRSLRQALRVEASYYRAPPSLRKTIGLALDRAERSEPVRSNLAGVIGRAKSFWLRPWFMGAAAGASATAAIAIILVVLLLPPTQDPLAEDVTAAHLRSLMANHLFDVPSSDQHTVKPWFDGHVDVSPPVADFVAQGFRLVGGRADYVDGRRTAVVVYRRNAHVINMFSWLDDGARLPPAESRNGFNLRFWRAGGLAFCAISDVAPGDLDTFVQLVKTGSPSNDRE
jgi:anti-sigma factor RsiW